MAAQAAASSQLAAAQRVPLLPAAPSARIHLPACHLAPPGATSPPFHLQDFKEAVVQYRARLSSIVRFSAAVLPEHALQSAAARLDRAVAACAPGSGELTCPEAPSCSCSFAPSSWRPRACLALHPPCPSLLCLPPSPALPARPAGTKPEDARSLLESAVHFMESAFKAVWDGSIREQPAKLQGECMMERSRWWVVGAQSAGVGPMAGHGRIGGMAATQAQTAPCVPSSSHHSHPSQPSHPQLRAHVPLLLPQPWWQRWSRCCSGCWGCRWGTPFSSSSRPGDWRHSQSCLACAQTWRRPPWAGACGLRVGVGLAAWRPRCS